jgi:hypothetical protein
MSDFRDPYDPTSRPMGDRGGLYTDYDRGVPTWGWVAGIVVVALIVAFFAFGTNGPQTAGTNPQDRTAERPAPSTMPPTMPPTRTPAPGSTKPQSSPQ